MIKENVGKVIADVERACRNVGRHPKDITIVGVTKYVSLPEIQEAIDAGIAHIAENRVQEARIKFPLLVQHNPTSENPYDRPSADE